MYYVHIWDKISRLEGGFRTTELWLWNYPYKSKANAILSEKWLIEDNYQKSNLRVSTGSYVTG